MVRVSSPVAGYIVEHFGPIQEIHNSPELMKDAIAEFFNTFNFAQFFPPEPHVGNPNIGKISRAGEPRDIQFGLKLSF